MRAYDLEISEKEEDILQIQINYLTEVINDKDTVMKWEKTEILKIPVQVKGTDK